MSNACRTFQRAYSNVIPLICALIILASGYHSLAFMTWQWRNPKANAMTFYSHYSDVVTWKKLPEFQ